MSISDFRRPVGRRVERDFDLDPPRVADDRDALMRRELGCGGEGQMTAPGEFEYRASQPVGAEIRVAVQRRRDPDRFGAEHESRRQDRVAADVVEAAAAWRPVAHVVGVEQAI